MARTIQGVDEIEIAAPIETVWPLIADSTRLAEWGPPVKSVTLLSPSPERIGSRRRVAGPLVVLSRASRILR
jgi:uncharacterized protein YndB with AHSA1/START domain